MLRKKLYIALNVILCCFAVTGVSAQISIAVPEANISSQTDFILTNVLSGKYNGVLVLLPRIGVKAVTANLPATTTGTSASLPLNVVHIKLTAIGGLNLLGISLEITLSTQDLSIFNSLAGLSGGNMIADYRIATAGNLWVSGRYSTTLSFSPSDRVAPPSLPFEIVVPSFITLNTQIPATTVLNVNSLSFFRTTAGISTDSPFDYFTSVPTLLNLKANSSAFIFTTTSPYNHLPAAAGSNQLKAALTDGLAGPAINLSNSDQLLTVSSGLPVILTNKRTLTSTLSITGLNLKNNFVQAGTYKLPVTYTVSKTAVAYPPSLAPKMTNSTVQVTVSNMSELIVQNSSVSLNFNSAAAYQQGVTTQMPGHIKVSSTTPYNVTVKASSNFFTASGGSQIPVGVVIIEGMPSQTGINPVTLSASPQVLVSSANPEIDRLLNLQYRIPATQTSNLLGKPAGTYTTTITYSLVAP